jgi:hypothetical protein
MSSMAAVYSLTLKILMTCIKLISAIDINWMWSRKPANRLTASVQSMASKLLSIYRSTTPAEFIGKVARTTSHL